MTITQMITHVTCSFNDRIFKPIQECRLKRQYTFFPGKIDRTMTKSVKLKKVTKKFGLDTMQVLTKCAKVIIIQPHSLEWQNYFCPLG